MRAKALWMSTVTMIAFCGVVHASPIAQRIPFSIQVPLAAEKTYTFTFSLFDTSDVNTGTEFWRERKAYTVRASKTLNHMLGSVYPFRDGMSNFGGAAVPVDFTQQLWVQVKAGSFVSRVKLHTVPYAITALSTLGLRAEMNETSPNLIGGNPRNDFSPGVVGASIAGGGLNEMNPEYPSEDLLNKVSGSFGAIGGGLGNRAGERAVVAGGWSNHATGSESSVCGGRDNRATGNEASILGGVGGRATGAAATVAGGCTNTASGYRGFAAGEEANASRRGMFVWSATDDEDPDGGGDPRFNRVYEKFGGFPQATLDGTTPNPLIKDMQFWVKAPGGVFFVTGQDDIGQPLGVKLAQGSQQWEPITTSPQLAADVERAPGSSPSAAAPQSLEGYVFELEKRILALEAELAAGRAQTVALRARIEDLSLRQAELRRLLAGEPRHGSERANADTNQATRH